MVVEFLISMIAGVLRAVFLVLPGFTLPAQITAGFVTVGTFMGSGLGRFKHVFPTGALVTALTAVVLAFVVATTAWALLWVWARLPFSGGK